MENGFWGQGVDNDVANTIWDDVQYFVKLENMGTNPRGEAGNELDQFWAAKFLEDRDKAITSLARKEALRTIDVDNNGKMSCIEYLVWKYKKSVTETENAPQGGGTPEDARRLAEAQEELGKLNGLLAELQAAQMEQKKQEDEFNRKCRELEQTSKEGKSTVIRSKAANELAQMKAEDPLPLRRAKITTDAAVRKVLKQIAHVQELIEELKRKGSVAAGTLWWMQRELFEADARLPTSKMKFNHSKPFYYDPLS